MDEVRPSQNKNRQSKTVDTTRCHQVGVEGMGIYQSGDHHEIFLSCGISNALDGSEDDCVNSDVPPLEVDDTTEDEQVHDSDADADYLGNPFSEDETDSEN